MSVYPNAPGHRNIDTSVAAADDVAQSLGWLQRLTETAFDKLGPQGLRLMIQPRTSGLRRKRRIRDSRQRRPNRTGKRAIVWVTN